MASVLGVAPDIVPVLVEGCADHPLRSGEEGRRVGVTSVLWRLVGCSLCSRIRGVTAWDAPVGWDPSELDHHALCPEGAPGLNDLDHDGLS